MTDELPPIDPLAAPGGASRTVKIMLFLSLALNLVIIGAVAGALVIGRPDRNGGPGLREAGLGPLEMVLTRAQRGVLRDQLRAQEGEIRQNREAMRADIGRLLGALRAEPFDAAVFAQVLEEQRHTVTARQEIGHRALVEAVMAATPGQRRDMADRIENALRRGDRWGRHR